MLFVGIATFVRSVAINFEDARWLKGMGLLRRGYFEVVPGGRAVLRDSLGAEG